MKYRPPGFTVAPLEYAGCRRPGEALSTCHFGTLSAHEPSPPPLSPPRMAESLPPSHGANQTKPTEKEPIRVQLDPEWCVNSKISLATEYLTYDQPPFRPPGVLRTIENQRFPCRLLRRLSQGGRRIRQRLCQGGSQHYPNLCE